MQHNIPVNQLRHTIGPQVEGMARAVEACVHCGFCLPACPTYRILGEEMNSPRGRIILMKAALEGELSAPEVKPYIDLCLGCLACTTACPSGVEYEALVTPFRAYARDHGQRPFMEKARERLAQELLPHPGRFRLAAAAGRLAKPFQELLPDELHGMLALLPEHLPHARPLPAFVPAQGPRRGRVALLAGCVQQALAPQINWATLQVLAMNGVEVVIPAEQGCCGALPMHIGDLEAARRMALHNLGVFPTDVDSVLTNAAGCGSAMKHYELLFEDDFALEEVIAFSRRVRDVSEFLDELGIQAPSPLPQPLRVAYHDACHLAHAQKITAAPRRLLKMVPGLSITEVAEADICCGSAGTYNLEQPEMAGQLGQRKVGHILATGAEAVVTGNIGCMVQIRNHLEALDQPRPVYHVMEVLAMAYGLAG